MHKFLETKGAPNDRRNRWKATEKIASGNLSDIGESDEEGDVHKEVLWERIVKCLVPANMIKMRMSSHRWIKKVQKTATYQKTLIGKRPYVPPPDIHFSGHDEFPPEADETCTPYVHFSIYEPESIFKVIADNTNQRALRQRAVNSA